MICCSIWADAIADCALGDTPEPGLAAHLASCADCRYALHASQAMAARIDEALHRGAGADPPLYGPERVMARIRRRPLEPRAWERWTVAASVVLGIGIAAAIWVRHPAPDADVAALSRWRSPTEVLLRPPLAAWSARPRLGEALFRVKPLFKIRSAFKFNPSGERHAL